MYIYIYIRIILSTIESCNNEFVQITHLIKVPLAINLVFVLGFLSEWYLGSSWGDLAQPPGPLSAPFSVTCSGSYLLSNPRL